MEGFCSFLHENVQGQVQRLELGGESPYRCHGAEVQLQHVNSCAGDVGHDGLLDYEPGGDVADGHDDVHTAQRQDARRLQPDSTRRTCSGSS